MPNTLAQIQKFIYNISNEDYAAATQELKEIISIKQHARFDEEYNNIQESHDSTDKKERMMMKEYGQLSFEDFLNRIQEISDADLQQLGNVVGLQIRNRSPKILKRLHDISIRFYRNTMR